MVGDWCLKELRTGDRNLFWGLKIQRQMCLNSWTKLSRKKTVSGTVVPFLNGVFAWYLSWCTSATCNQQFFAKYEELLFLVHFAKNSLSFKLQGFGKKGSPYMTSVLWSVQQCPARMDIGSSRSEKWNENLVHLFREVKSEMKISFTHFENEKWNENALRSRSRMKSEMKIP